MASTRALLVGGQGGPVSRGAGIISSLRCWRARMLLMLLGRCLGMGAAKALSVGLLADSSWRL